MSVSADSPVIRHLPCLGTAGFHRLAMAVWPGQAGGRATICVHGLTRNGRDFDTLARALSARGPVFAPDMAGRGRSEWLPSKADYGYPLYIQDVATVIAAMGVEEVDFVGTSMGGIIGMMLASRPGSPIRRLVINDVGPFIPKAAIARLGTYVGRDPSFADLNGLEAYLRTVAASFGPLSDAEWRHLATHGHRILPDGRVGLAYDPAIGGAFQAEPQDVVLWPFYDAIKCPILLLWGTESDLLLEATAREMTERGPKALLHPVHGVGHAPALMATDQVAAIVDFLGA